jgi:alpha-L-arabinofuranosidase
VTNLDPRQAAEIDVAALGFSAKAATGETLAAPRFNSINTFEAPNTVAPKPFGAKAKGGKLMLPLAPASVTVVKLEP